MNKIKKAVFNWSGGKDSALALHKTLKNKDLEVVALFTTFNEETRKSSMHSLPLEILSKQAKSIGIPLYTMYFSKDLKNYDEKMLEAVTHFKTLDVTNFIFGDLTASGLKTYRESKLNPLGIEVIEPLWDKSSDDIMKEFLESGIKTKIIVTQEGKLDKSYIGKTLDDNLISTFPKDIDVCGEQGEYHTLAYEGPLFKHPIDFSISKVYETSYEFMLEDGTVQTCVYWSAKFNL
ncbi:diphthine--ammonia ligase [Gelidibacter sp.]|uniref:Dph6-related ATP pyrophosphatase n=1 Tax=Gelidibacter sp. TaxID=2018083 RepID=UPI0032656D73